MHSEQGPTPRAAPGPGWSHDHHRSARRAHRDSLEGGATEPGGVRAQLVRDRHGHRDRRQRRGHPARAGAGTAAARPRAVGRRRRAARRGLGRDRAPLDPPPGDRARTPRRPGDGALLRRPRDGAAHRGGGSAAAGSTAARRRRRPRARRRAVVARHGARPRRGRGRALPRVHHPPGHPGRRVRRVVDVGGAADGERRDGPAPDRPPGARRPAPEPPAGLLDDVRPDARWRA